MAFSYRDGALTIAAGLESRKAGARSWRARVVFTDRHSGATETLNGDWTSREQADEQLKNLNRIFATN